MRTFSNNSSCIKSHTGGMELPQEAGAGLLPDGVIAHFVLHTFFSPGARKRSIDISVDVTLVS